MATFKDINCKFKWKEGRVERVIEYFGLEAIETALRNFKLIKKRKKFKCMKCGKTFPKGTHAVLTNTYSDGVCYKCAKEWYANSIKMLDALIEDFKKDIDRINRNEGKWDKIVIVNTL